MLITLKDAKKIYGGESIFEELNFEIKPGAKIGLVGRNGTGKSTLFKLITNEEQLDEGQLFIRKETTIGYLAQIPNFLGTVKEYLGTSFKSLNELENRMKEMERLMQDPQKMENAIAQYGELQEEFSRLGGYEVQSKIDMVTNGLGIHYLLDQPFDKLSGGEQTKTGLAKILLEEPDVLLLDEPTNHLDLKAIEWLESFIQQFKGACCMISHDRYFLDRTVSEIADLENGEISYYQGNFSYFVKEKEDRLLAEFKAYQEQQKKIKKMKEAIKRLRQWANEANPPSEKLFKKAKSMEKALERIEKMDRPLVDPKTMDLHLSAEERSGEDVILAKQLSKCFGSKDIISNLNLHIRFKERVAIVGTNGSGKTTLLKLILGKEEPTKGDIKVGSNVVIGYLPQNPMQGEDQEVKLIDYFRDHVVVTEGQARQILAKFMFFGYSVFRKISQLSGGERMRLKLAVFMHQGINLLILDEPTNHLDIESQEVLEEALERFNGTVICVSHDRYFLNRCFPETAFLVGGQLSRHLGNFNEKKHEWDALLDRLIEGKQRKSNALEKPSVPKREPLKKKDVDIELQIERLEEEIEQINSYMEQETDAEALMVLQKEKESFLDKLDLYYEEWLELKS